MSADTGRPLDLTLFRDLYGIPLSEFGGGVPSIDPRVLLERRLERMVPRQNRIAMFTIHFKPPSAGPGRWACTFCANREKG